jgi:prevent-host-death family protein
MRQVTIQELRRHLSALIAEVAAGTRILVTKHEKAIACLLPAEDEHVHWGRRFHKGSLEPLLSKGTGGRYLEILADDRRGGAR